MSRLTKRQEATIRQVLSVARLEQAIFRGPGNVPFPKYDSEVDAFVKDRIRNWADSWIVGPLEALLAESKR